MILQDKTAFRVATKKRLPNTAIELQADGLQIFPVRYLARNYGNKCEFPQQSVRSFNSAVGLTNSEIPMSAMLPG